MVKRKSHRNIFNIQRIQRIEGKSVVAERFITTLKNKIYKHKIAVSKMFTLMF